MSIFDSIGTAFEGGLFARAVEPRHGESATGTDGHTHEGTCLNCGTALMGPHCHSCGQKAHVHKTLGAFMHDLLHGALHFEGKTWHTLPLLAFKPGQLTRRYIEGERAKFVSPMALFLFSVFLMFAVFQLAGITPPTEIGVPAQVDTAIESAQGRRAQLEAMKEARASMGDGNVVARPMDRQIAELEKQVAADEASGEGAPAEEASAYEETAVAAASEPITLTTARTGITFIDHGLEKWEKNPGLMAYKMQANSYKFSWLLIPLSVPFVWLIFAWKRRFGAYDHAVFVTYSLAFMTLFYVALVLLGSLGVGNGTLGLLGTTIPFFHIYKQIKSAYGLSRFSAVWRTVVLTVFIVIILFLFIDLLLVLGAIG